MVKAGSYKKANNTWPMDPEIKERWVAALTDNSYEQSEGQLAIGYEHSKGKFAFCCLGVLCDLYAKDNDLSWIKECGGGLRLEGSDVSSYLPEHVAAWAGFQKKVISSADDAGLDIKPPTRKKTLASENDSGASFKEIAKIIEDNL